MSSEINPGFIRTKTHIKVCFLSYLRPFIQDLLTDVLVLLQQPLLSFTLCVFQLYTQTHKDNFRVIQTPSG